MIRRSLATRPAWAGIAAFATAVPPAAAELVINEIYHDAEPKTARVEFVEILNTGSGAAPLGGYRLEGVGFTFPAGASLAPGAFAVVGESPSADFRFDGALSSDGERITLRAPDGAVVDRVDYRARFPWPVTGGGTSMQLVNPGLDNDLGASWRPAAPTPGATNATSAANAPPALRQVAHSPRQPTSAEALTVQVKATDPDGVAGVTLLYQTNAPGAFAPAFLPLSSNALRNNPSTALTPNPAFEQDWTAVPMTPDASGEVFSAAIPPQPHRTLVRYRIAAEDALGAAARAPFPDDPSLNFAAFSYDGVPDYVEDDGTVHPSAALTAIPVYHLITRGADLAQCWGYDSADRAGGVASRAKYNWEGALVYDGVVYDHVEYRLRQRNDRYAGAGRRSMKFRFRRGNEFAARDPSGKLYPSGWRRMNTGKMSRFAEGANFGLREVVSSRLWNIAGSLAPEFQHVHFRVIDAAAEAPDQHRGDFFGLAMVFEDVDAQFVANRGMAPGNLYKLRDGVSDPLELQKYQSRDAVADGSDFVNIRDKLGPPAQGDAWLRAHVDWDAWYLYAAVGEGCRHYDFSPHFQKNRIWYFRPEPGAPLGLMSVIPHDTDATWKRGTNDNQWDDPRWGPGPGSQRGRVVGYDLPKEAIAEIAGLDGTDGENHPERAAFMLEYRNVLREVHDLLWQPETVDAVIDQALATIAPLEAADRARWTGAPASAGNDSFPLTMEAQAALMRSLAFEEDLYMGSSLAGGRKEWLRRLSLDPDIPATPTLARDGGTLTSSPFADPGGAATFAAAGWRIAERPQNGAGGKVDLVASGDLWRYFDLGTDPGDGWASTGFDDAAWAVGPSKFGHGDDDETTTLTRGNTANFFRKWVTVDDPDAFSRFDAGIVRDDGAVISVNGVEVWRTQMPDGPAGYLTRANMPAFGANEREFQPFTIPASAFVAGENLIAVSVHQTTPLSDDTGFDFQLAGHLAPQPLKHEWHATWNAETTSLSITPPAVATRPGLPYLARVRHRDTSGRWSHWSAPLEFVATQPDVSLFTSAIVVSELMYHPAPPSPEEVAAGFNDDDAFEYLEIRNVGPEPVPLDDLRFTKGVDIDLAGTLAPGATALVVNNLAAFELRHGPGLPVLGEWSGKLDNGGENVKLSYGAGIPVREFRYDDVAPWPTAADGAGGALVLIDPLALPDHADPLNWRAAAPGPGASDTTTFAGGDLLAYATGGEPPRVEVTPGGIALTATLNTRAEDLLIEWQQSPDLQTWTPAPLERLGQTVAAPGFAQLQFLLVGAGDTPPQFVRMHVALRGGD